MRICQAVVRDSAEGAPAGVARGLEDKRRGSCLTSSGHWGRRRARVRTTSPRNVGGCVENGQTPQEKTRGQSLPSRPGRGGAPRVEAVRAWPLVKHIANTASAGTLGGWVPRRLPVSLVPAPPRTPRGAPALHGGAGALGFAPVSLRLCFGHELCP